MTHPQSSDAIVCSENDLLHDICTTLLDIRRPSFDDMNNLIAQHLSAFLLPSMDVCNSQTVGEYRMRPPPTDWFDFPVDPMARLSAELCPHPGMKLLSTYVVPQV